MPAVLDRLLGRCRDQLHAGDRIIYTYGYTENEFLRHVGEVIEPDTPDSENVEVRFDSMLDPERPRFALPVLSPEETAVRRSDLRHYPRCPRRT